jgi:hypothetical protein
MTPNLIFQIFIVMLCSNSVQYKGPGQLVAETVTFNTCGNLHLESLLPH